MERLISFSELSSNVGEAEARRLIQLAIKKGSGRWYDVADSWDYGRDAYDPNSLPSRGKSTGKKGIDEEIISFLNTKPGGAFNAREIRQALGQDSDFDPYDPLKNPVHQALVRLRDSGKIEIITCGDRDWETI